MDRTRITSSFLSAVIRLVSVITRQVNTLSSRQTIDSKKCVLVELLVTSISWQHWKSSTSFVYEPFTNYSVSSTHIATKLVACRIFVDYADKLIRISSEMLHRYKRAQSVWVDKLQISWRKFLIFKLKYLVQIVILSVIDSDEKTEWWAPVGVRLNSKMCRKNYWSTRFWIRWNLLESTAITGRLKEFAIVNQIFWNSLKNHRLS